MASYNILRFMDVLRIFMESRDNNALGDLHGYSVSSMDMPARRKILAEIADGRGVGTIIASLDLITSTTSIPGPMIAGFLYSYVGVLGIFWIGSLINLVGALFLLKIRG